MLFMVVASQAQTNPRTTPARNNPTDSNRTTPVVTGQTTGSTAGTTSASNSNKPKDSSSDKSEVPTKIGKRFSFIIGGGVSTFKPQLYVDPIVNPINNFVQLQEAQKVKANLTFGIQYTPYTVDIIETHSYEGPNQSLVERQSVEQVQKGWTYAFFINPILFSKISESQSFFNNPDMGIGVGRRWAGGVSAMFTIDYFSVRQPRDWFIEQFKGNNTAYTIAGSIQKSIDLNDNNIFVPKPVFTFGVKVAVSFEIVKQFVSTTTSVTTSTGASTSTRTTTTVPNTNAQTPTNPQNQ